MEIFFLHQVKANNYLDFHLGDSFFNAHIWVDNTKFPVDKGLKSPIRTYYF